MKPREIAEWLFDFSGLPVTILIIVVCVYLVLGD
jgi:hypothetical protein